MDKFTIEVYLELPEGTNENYVPEYEIKRLNADILRHLRSYFLGTYWKVK